MNRDKGFMVSIEVAGKDRTAQLSDWSLSWNDSRAALQLTCHFPSGKTYTHPLSDCRVLPTRELNDLLLTESGSTLVKAVSKAIIYGERYAAVYYQGDRPYLYKMDRIRLTPATALKASPVFHYFSCVANARRDRAMSKADRDIAANVVRQLEKLPAWTGTALHAYCTGRNGNLASSQGLIYPFGLNESQLSAVEQAFRKQISVIEGPPGTGKPDHPQYPRQYPAARPDGGRAVQQQCRGGKRLREAGEMRPRLPDRQTRQLGQSRGILREPTAASHG